MCIQEKGEEGKKKEKRVKEHHVSVPVLFSFDHYQPTTYM